MTLFNAWRDPWVPVRTVEGDERLESLRGVFADSGELAGLGAALTPLDRDSLYRFLPSIAGVLARGLTDAEWDALLAGSGFPDATLDAFADQFEARFNLFGEQPFLQRWDRSHADLEALFSLEGLDAKQLKSRLSVRATKLKTLETLHPHVPGKSSSQWAIRRDDRDPSQDASLTLLLVSAWFQTKNGNSRDPWGNKSLKGSAGTWHVNPLAIYLTNPASLTDTILANTPVDWAERDDLPVFLAHGPLPKDLAEAVKTSVARFSYAKTLPLVLFEAGQPTGFISGADDTIAVPQLGVDEKESLGLIHAHDHTRLYVRKPKKDAPDEIVPRASFGARLSSTEGFERWFRADNRVSDAIRDWRVLPRIRSVGNEDLTRWNYSLLSDNGDAYGTREWASWDEIPADFASAAGGTLVEIQTLFQFASECRSKFAYAARTATGESGTPALAVTGQAAFYSGVMPVILAVADDVHHQRPLALAGRARQIAEIAVAAFAHATDPLMVPARVADVARARADFARLIHRDRSTRFAADTAAKESA